MRHLKKWAGLPQCATRSIVHSSHVLDIPSIQSMYLKAHASAYCNIAGSASSDQILEASVQNRTVREESAAVPTITREVIKIAEEVRTITDRPVNQASLKRSICDRQKEEHLTQARKLMVQGEFLQLLHEENVDVDWKSFAFELPRNLLRFALNASINCLPTRSNLKRWNKGHSDKCKLCGNIETTAHVLSSCQTALVQGRFTFRHDSVLSYIVRNIDKEKFKVLADLDGFRTAAGGTVPPNVLVTSERPDLVVVDKETGELAMFELTIPHEQRIQVSEKIKTRKYEHLVQDISAKGLSVSFDTLEIGCRGLVSKKNKDVMSSLLLLCSKSMSRKEFIKGAVKTTLLGSYYIYLARNEPSWTDSPLIEI